MRKHLSAIIITALLLLSGFTILLVKGNETDYISYDQSNLISHEENLWTPEDEGDHFPCGCEWWMFYVALELEDGTHWDASATFQYNWIETENGTELRIYTLLMYYFDRENKTCYDFSSSEVDKKPFSFKKNVVDLRYYNCTIYGLYPNYLIHLENDEMTFILDLQLEATSVPHWAAQEGGNGYFPWGLGSAKYGFIPRLNASGEISIGGRNSHITGTGYFEHAWGNFTYFVENPLSKIKEFIKNIPKILHLWRWFKSEQQRHFIDRLMYSTDNMFGYDWSWATLDNGWTLQLGIFHFGKGVAAGPVPGVLSVSPDGQTYWDFADVDIKYGKLYYITETDTYLPLDMEVTARKGDKLIHMIFNTTTDPYKFLGVYPRTRFSRGTMASIHAAGVADGYYIDKKQKIPLHGICTIASYRQLFATRYASLEINRLRPPAGLGFSSDLISHRLGFELFFERQLLPYPQRHFYLKPISITTPEKPPEQSYDGSKLYVGGFGVGNYSRIQDAIDNASEGDTVFVYGGEYQENILIDKAIRLVGEDKNKVLLHAGNKDGIKTIANSVEITGFTIEAEQADSYDDSAIDLSSSGNYVHDNNVIKSEWYGIFVFNSSSNVIENNSIIDNDIGVWLCRAVNSVVRYNNISLSNYVGIWLWPYSKDNTICYNNFFGSKVNARNSDLTTRNTWSHNYLDDWIGLKFRRLADLNRNGIGNIPYRISRFEFDWHPAMEPYEI